MDYSVLEKSILFSGLTAKTIREVLEEVPHHIEAAFAASSGYGSNPDIDLFFFQCHYQSCLITSPSLPPSL